MAVTSVIPSVEGAMRAGNVARRNSARALNRFSRSWGFESCGVTALSSARGVVLVQAGPRSACRCSASQRRVLLRSGSALRIGAAVRSESAAVSAPVQLRSASEPNTSLTPDPPSQWRR